MSDLVSILQADVAAAAPLPNYVRNAPQTEASIRHAAQEFEAVFLTEMLKHAGLGQMPDAMNGGVGEAAFSDFLAREYSMGIAETRSIGIAEQVYRALKAEGSQ